jgi:hypothetical protein
MAKFGNHGIEATSSKHAVGIPLSLFSDKNRNLAILELVRSNGLALLFGDELVDRSKIKGRYHN